MLFYYFLFIILFEDRDLIFDYLHFYFYTYILTWIGKRVNYILNEGSWWEYKLWVFYNDINWWRCSLGSAASGLVNPMNLGMIENQNT